MMPGESLIRCRVVGICMPVPMVVMVLVRVLVSMVVMVLICVLVPMVVMVLMCVRVLVLMVIMLVLRMLVPMVLVIMRSHFIAMSFGSVIMTMIMIVVLVDRPNAFHTGQHQAVDDTGIAMKDPDHLVFLIAMQLSTLTEAMGTGEVIAHF